MPYPRIVVRFSSEQSDPQKGKRLKTAQFEGYVETRPEAINNEIHDIDVQTPFLSCSAAAALEKALSDTNGGPFHLINNRQDLGLFRVAPFVWSIKSKPLPPKWENIDIDDLFPSRNGGWVRSLKFKVERAYGVEE